MLRLKAYRFQLQPSQYQECELYSWSHALRFLWNWMLAQRRDAYKASEGRVRVTYTEQAAQLMPMKEIYPWLGLLPSQSLQQALLDLDRAFVNFFQGRAQYPCFKRRQGAPSGIRWPQGVRLNGRCVWLPKLGWVKAKLSRKVKGAIKNATVRSDGLHWFVSIQVEEEMTLPAETPISIVAVDLGVEESLALSDETLIRLPVATQTEEQRLAMLDRRVSRCVPGSKRHMRAKRKRLIFRRRIINRVADTRHKMTTRLAKNHGRVVAEDLAIKALTRSALGSPDKPGVAVNARAARNRAFLEQGHAETLRQLDYKLSWLGRELIKVNPAYTSQTCPNCGHVSRDNRPTRRRFACVACGLTGHADIIAAKNILAAGLAVSARGGPQGLEKREPTRALRIYRQARGIPAL